MLSLSMIVRNEEARLGECLRSVQSFAAEMVVVDTGSTDATVPSAAALSGWPPALRTPETQGFRSIVLHGEGLSPWSGQADAPLAMDRLGDGAVLLQLFLRGNPFRAGRNAQEPWAAAIQQLIALNRLAGVVVYGSPYLWDSLKSLLPSSCPAAYSAGQMQEAQRQVLTKLFPSATPTGKSLSLIHI